MSQKTYSIHADDYREYANMYYGICIGCGAWAEQVEPDAHEYPCQECGENAVMGAEEALLAGHLDIKDEE